MGEQWWDKRAWCHLLIWAFSPQFDQTVGKPKENVLTIPGPTDSGTKNTRNTTKV